MSIPVKQRLLFLLVVDFPQITLILNNFNFNVDGNNLEIVSDIVYLGVNFS